MKTLIETCRTGLLFKRKSLIFLAMKLLLTSLLVLLSLLAPRAQAACTSLDLRNETLGEPRDQKNVSWCYAYTISDMVAHHYHLPRLSAADIAITYNHSPLAEKQRKLYEVYFKMFRPELLNTEHTTGFMQVALKTTFARGVCLEKEFPSDFLTRITTQENTSEQVPMAQAIREIHLQKESRDSTSYYAFPNVDRAAYFQFLAGSDIHDLFFNISEQACKNSRFQDFGKMAPVHHYKNKKSLGEIDQILEGGDIAGIEYFPTFLYNLDAKIWGLHTSSIVARRMNEKTQSCEYLIRNSRGSDCSKYDARLECENGHIWVPGDLLKSRLISVSHFEESKP